MNQKLYSQEAIQQIPKRASAIDEAQTVVPNQLEQIASELGISTEALERAKVQWQADQTKCPRWLARLRSAKALRQHLWIYSISNVILGISMNAPMNLDFWPIPVVWMSLILWQAQGAASLEEQAGLAQPEHDNYALPQSARRSRL